MTDTQLLLNIASLQLHFMAFILMLVLVYAILMIIYIVLMLAKRQGLPKIKNPLKQAVDETISNFPSDSQIETTEGRVVKLLTPKERKAMKEKQVKRQLGLK